MRHTAWIASLGMGLTLSLSIGCDNPESREAREEIREATTATGRAMERSVGEGVQNAGQGLEQAGERMQSSVDPGGESTAASSTTTTTDPTFESDTSGPPEQVIVSEPEP